MNNELLVQYVATACFALAILHTFSVKLLQKLARRYPDGSVGENLLHLLAEVEVVFGIWAGIFIIISIFISGTSKTIAEIEQLNFKEALFVFVIMTICATQPILFLCEKVIRTFGRFLPLNANLGFFCATMIIGPLLGSFITEPAAMTVTALILLKNFYQKDVSDQLRYATLGLLFVNVSIGGTLTPYAAPPVLMVASIWNWNLAFMFINFGWKAIIAIIVSTGIICFRFRQEITAIKYENLDLSKAKMPPPWVIILHLAFLIAIVRSSHYTVLFMGLFLFFLGVASVTKEYQSELKIKESLLVGFFLGGLVVLGGYQSWWLQPILSNLTASSLYLGAMSLTAITDNAAITYLGSQVAGLSDVSKYVLVAGSVVGGGLTVIANAPNPAGYSTLNASFGTDGISPTLLFRSALLPTFIAALCFWFF
ncbi:MAG: putative Na+/H+ antiporter [Bdellovibrionaceae bacterium]|nr:putative Na+/H+ antiporter [Pseudobdellovibrionaceae bacterium]